MNIIMTNSKANNYDVGNHENEKLLLRKNIILRQCRSLRKEKMALPALHLREGPTSKTYKELKRLGTKNQINQL